MKTAILIDGGFFLKRYEHIIGFKRDDTPKTFAENIVKYCFRHIRRINNYRKRYELPLTELYRIFYYDAKPFEGDTIKPVSKKPFNFKNSEQYKFRNELFEELYKQRKIALRLGFLKNTSKSWTIKSRHTKPLLKGEKKVAELKDEDFYYPIIQKSVDMKIGLDIASLSFKNKVSQIILVAGDSDFVPAAKFARKEGIDFILDPMMNNIDTNLQEHIDDLMSIKDMSVRTY